MEGITIFEALDFESSKSLPPKLTVIGENDTVFCDLCFDFDGVIHSYKSGWQGADVITDPPVPNAMAALRYYVKHFSIAIYSARSGQPGGIEKMKWFVGYWNSIRDLHNTEHDLVLQDVIAFPEHKPAAKVYIDDRGVRFEGNWLHLDTLRKLMVPWYQKTDKV